MSAVTRLSDLFLRVAVALQPIALFLARIAVGWAFVGTGRGKWQHIDKIEEFFASIHFMGTGIGLPFPEANAMFIASLELVGGIALVLGLATRPVAALLASTMVVAILTADWGDFLAIFTGAKGPLDVTPVQFLLPLLFLIAYGSGPLAIDRLIGKRAAK